MDLHAYPVKSKAAGDFWSTWLFVVVMALSAFGVALAFLSATPLFTFFHRQIDPVFWGTQPVSGAAQAYQQWVYGVLGAVLVSTPTLNSIELTGIAGKSDRVPRLTQQGSSQRTSAAASAFATGNRSFIR